MRDDIGGPLAEGLGSADEAVHQALGLGACQRLQGDAVELRAAGSEGGVPFEEFRAGRAEHD